MQICIYSKIVFIFETVHLHLQRRHRPEPLFQLSFPKQSESLILFVHSDVPSSERVSKSSANSSNDGKNSVLICVSSWEVR